MFCYVKKDKCIVMKKKDTCFVV